MNIYSMGTLKFVTLLIYDFEINTCNRTNLIGEGNFQPRNLEQGDSLVETL